MPRLARKNNDGHLAASEKRVSAINLLDTSAIQTNAEQRSQRCAGLPSPRPSSSAVQLIQVIASG
jgi:hypothetical protein